jgi:hypothetical protein
MTRHAYRALIDPKAIAAHEVDGGTRHRRLRKRGIVSRFMEHASIDAYLFLVRPAMAWVKRPVLHGVTHNARLTPVEATPTKSDGLLPTRHAPQGQHANSVHHTRP